MKAIHSDFGKMETVTQNTNIERKTMLIFGCLTSISYIIQNVPLKRPYYDCLVFQSINILQCANQPCKLFLDSLILLNI